MRAETKKAAVWATAIVLVGLASAELSEHVRHAFPGTVGMVFGLLLLPGYMAITAVRMAIFVITHHTEFMRVARTGSFFFTINLTENAPWAALISWVFYWRVLSAAFTPSAARPAKARTTETS
jgi:hypothetical protein